MNDIFTKLMANTIDKAVYDFHKLSSEVFVNKDGIIINPGEFGTYREKIIADLLKRFIPNRYAIGTGFIITSKNKISTQCDIIIYDKETTPVLETNDQRFYPVESVVCVIEVKSKLNKTTFKEALLKLSKIKELREDISSRAAYVYKDKLEHLPFDTKTNVRDQIATFLICDSVEFNVKESLNCLFNQIYKDIDRSLFHNMILSINDGCFLYYTDDNKHMYYPYFNYNLPFRNSFVLNHNNGYQYEYILLFLDYFFMCVSSVSVLFVDITHYIGPTRIKQSYIEQINEEKK